MKNFLVQTKNIALGFLAIVAICVITVFSAFFTVITVVVSFLPALFLWLAAKRQ